MGPRLAQLPSSPYQAVAGLANAKFPLNTTIQGRTLQVHSNQCQTFHANPLDKDSFTGALGLLGHLALGTGSSAFRGQHQRRGRPTWPLSCQTGKWLCRCSRSASWPVSTKIEQLTSIDKRPGCASICFPFLGNSTICAIFTQCWLQLAKQPTPLGLTAGRLDGPRSLKNH